ncbi:MAG: histidine--tRNA ligase [Verrucomicrobiales bacterium]|nr:histidine--tRNA ligase [Verrucomicrobiales bacterium]
MSKGFQTLKGFRDFYPDECDARNYVFNVWRNVAKRYGFVEYEGPILEPTDLYKKKSGDEIVTQLFCFEDKGGRDVSMRPELTPTLARMAAARQRDFKKPLRWFSIGQFFRYEKHQKGRGREFYQFNCDILGEESVAADAELAAISIDIMRELGFTADDFRLRVSDRKAWTDFAEKKGVGEEQIPEFLQIIDKKERTKPEDFEKALATFQVTPSDIEQFIQSGSDASETLQTIVADLTARGLGEFLEVDLRIVRGLAYYTGAVFEIFDIGKGMRAVAGGGRYDQLLKLVGGVDMAACGFAMGDMVITDLVRESEKPNQLLEAGISASQSIDVFVIVADEDRRNDAVNVVQRLRDANFRTAYAMTPAKMGKQFQSAEQMGAANAVIVGTEFPQVSLKNLAERTEVSCSADELIAELQSRK